MASSDVAVIQVGQRGMNGDVFRQQRLKLNNQEESHSKRISEHINDMEELRSQIPFIYFRIGILKSRNMFNFLRKNNKTKTK